MTVHPELKPDHHKEKIRAVELFSGIGGFRIACDELKIKTVWSNDLDEHAAAVYTDIFGSHEFMHGDISKLIDSIPEHDLLTGGFPCQPFSSAGKKLGVMDERGTLFEEIVSILKLKNPKYFVLENVKRLISMDSGEHFKIILTELSSLGYQIEWRLLNAINFELPQNRERIIIIGQRKHKEISFLAPSEDMDHFGAKFNCDISEITTWPLLSEYNGKFCTWGIVSGENFFQGTLKKFSQKKPEIKLITILEENPDRRFFYTEDTKKRLLDSEKVDRYFNGVEILYNQKGGARMGYSVFGTKGIAPTLTSSTSRHYERYKVGDEFRRLTNIEYARIQGFPDRHCEAASIYDQYALIGNAVPPAMVKWAIDRLVNNKTVNLADYAPQGVLL